MIALDIPPETVSAALRVKALRAQLAAAHHEVDRIGAELTEALDAYRPLQTAAYQTLTAALGQLEAPKPGPEPLRPAPRGDATAA